jgi:hypothetical protein
VNHRASLKAIVSVSPDRSEIWTPPNPRTTPAGTGVHSESDVGILASMIPTPCPLTQGRSLRLLCTVSLTDGSFAVSSETGAAHLKGTLRKFTAVAAAAAAPTGAAGILGGYMQGGVGGGAVSGVVDRGPDHLTGHWAHPALLDCSLHLATALASPTGVALFQLQLFECWKRVEKNSSKGCEGWEFWWIWWLRQRGPTWVSVHGEYTCIEVSMSGRLFFPLHILRVQRALKISRI